MVAAGETVVRPVNLAQASQPASARQTRARPGQFTRVVA